MGTKDQVVGRQEADAATGSALELPALCRKLARLCQYPSPRPAAGDGSVGGTPGDDWPALCRDLERRLRSSAPAAADALAEAGRTLGARTAGEREELYTRVFDMTPTTALDVGWHLFGESYERGAFLVRLGRRQREVGVDAGGELADHLPNVLALLAHLTGDEAGHLVHGCILPALEPVLSGLAKGESPYEAVVRGVSEALRVLVAPPAPPAEARAGANVYAGPDAASIPGRGVGAAPPPVCPTAPASASTAGRAGGPASTVCEVTPSC